MTNVAFNIFLISVFSNIEHIKVLELNYEPSRLHTMFCYAALKNKQTKKQTFYYFFVLFSSFIAFLNEVLIFFLL